MIGQRNIIYYDTHIRLWWPVRRTCQTSSLANSVLGRWLTPVAKLQLHWTRATLFFIGPWFCLLVIEPVSLNHRSTETERVILYHIIMVQSCLNSYTGKVCFYPWVNQPGVERKSLIQWYELEQHRVKRIKHIFKKQLRQRRLCVCWMLSLYTAHYSVLKW